VFFCAGPTLQHQTRCRIWLRFLDLDCIQVLKSLRVENMASYLDSVAHIATAQLAMPQSGHGILARQSRARREIGATQYRDVRGHRSIVRR
jgi:hypothetical protein